MLNELIKIARDAGTIALEASERKKTLKKEGHANFVTEYDLKIQEYIIEHVQKLFPQADIIAEESDDIADRRKSECRIIIDPIDGTTNFIRGSKEYCICICIVVSGMPRYGIVHLPELDTTYFAESGCGAFVMRNGTSEKIHVSSRGLDGALIAFGTSPYKEALADKSFTLARRLISRAADVRRSGSAALDICRVAQGVYDLMFEFELSIWDHAAAGVILSEAGGVYSDISGNDPYGRTKTSFVCGNKRAHTEFFESFGSIR